MLSDRRGWGGCVSDDAEGLKGENDLSTQGLLSVYERYSKDRSFSDDLQAMIVFEGATTKGIAHLKGGFAPVLRTKRGINTGPRAAEHERLE
jgi:hypothetical protein